MDTCESCRYFVKDDCRINPPQVFLRQNDGKVTLWPQVMRDGWCGQHAVPEKAHRFQLGSPATIPKE